MIRKKRTIALTVIVLSLSTIMCTCGSPGTTSPPRNATVIDVAANTGLAPWMEEAVEQFNKAKIETTDGSPVFVNLTLFELLVGIVLVGIILGGLQHVLGAGTALHAGNKDRRALLASARFAMERMVSHIQETDDILAPDVGQSIGSLQVSERFIDAMDNDSGAAVFDGDGILDADFDADGFINEDHHGWTWPPYLYSFGGQIFRDPPNDLMPMLDTPQSFEAAEFYSHLKRLNFTAICCGTMLPAVYSRSLLLR